MSKLLKVHLRTLVGVSVVSCTPEWYATKIEKHCYPHEFCWFGSFHPPYISFTIFPFLVWQEPAIFWESRARDHLGLLLFFLSVHQLCSQLKSELCSCYPDDVTLGSNMEMFYMIWRWWKVWPCDWAYIWTSRNLRWSASGDSAIRDSILFTVPAVCVVDATLRARGHWLLMCPSLPFSKKTLLLRTMGEGLQLSLLIMQSFSSSPLLLLCLTKTFQTLVMMLQWFTLLHFEWNYQPLFLWRGFCLGPSIPPSQSGLGVRSPAQLALSAFLASAAGSSNLIHHILLLHLQGKFVLCDIM